MRDKPVDFILKGTTGRGDTAKSGLRRFIAHEQIRKQLALGELPEGACEKMQPLSTKCVEEDVGLNRIIEELILSDV
jgi:hypothetical protein